MGSFTVLVGEVDGAGRGPFENMPESEVDATGLGLESGVLEVLNDSAGEEGYSGHDHFFYMNISLASNSISRLFILYLRNTVTYL